MSVPHFADRFIEAARALSNPLCVGLDPHLARIPQEFGVRPDEPTSEATARGVQDFFSVVIEECSGVVPVVKPQIAFFEQLGWRGIRALEELVKEARERRLLVILDAKRGDIGSTAEAYAKSYLYDRSPCQADAITLSPYLGLDSLEPFVKAARTEGVGLFVLARTSNPGAADFQSLSDGAGTPLYQKVAKVLSRVAAELSGASGWSNLGVVAGATYPEDAVALRRLLPNSLFLIPGYGAQGGSLESLAASFVTREGHLEGGIVSSSRAILFGDDSSSVDKRAITPSELAAEDFRVALRRRLRAARDELAALVRAKAGRE